MKKQLENLTVAFIVLLFLVVVGLVVMYNLIDDHSDDVYKIPEPSVKKETKKVKSESYVSSLESYGDDVDVKVDPTKEKHKNVVKVNSELEKDALDDVMKANEEKTYVKTLEDYTKKKKSTTSSKALEDVAPKQESNGDNIGTELENILGN